PRSTASSEGAVRRCSCCTAIRRRTRCGTASRLSLRSTSPSSAAICADTAMPDGGAGHINYSKRAMALDQIEVMRTLGFSRFRIAGHDRGARVTHRLCLDHPQAVERAAVLDISPTRLMYASSDMGFATPYYHWFFLIQPFDLPERLIGSDPVYYLRRKLGGLSSGLGVFDRRALAEYERCFADPATIHATCEDYRAAASIDLEHDAAD